MSKHILSDFDQGYTYACRHYKRLMGNSSSGELLELAKALLQHPGANAELARGMAAYCREMARKKQENE